MWKFDRIMGITSSPVLNFHLKQVSHPSFSVSFILGQERVPSFLEREPEPNFNRMLCICRLWRISWRPSWSSYQSPPFNTSRWWHGNRSIVTYPIKRHPLWHSSNSGESQVNWHSGVHAIRPQQTLNPSAMFPRGLWPKSRHEAIINFIITQECAAAVAFSSGKAPLQVLFIKYKIREN